MPRKAHHVIPTEEEILQQNNVPNEAMPRMMELEQEKLLAFGEGLAFMAKKRENVPNVSNV